MLKVQLSLELPSKITLSNSLQHTTTIIIDWVKVLWIWIWIDGRADSLKVLSGGEVTYQDADDDNLMSLVRLEIMKYVTALKGFRDLIFERAGHSSPSPTLSIHSQR